jgi:hypothetical protein
MILFQMSRQATSADATALIAAGFIPVAVKLLAHSQPVCVTFTIGFLLKVLIATGGGADDGQCHPHFTTFVAAGADRALLAILQSQFATAFNKPPAAVALATLYKEKELPPAFDIVRAELVAIGGAETVGAVAALRLPQSTSLLPGM